MASGDAEKLIKILDAFEKAGKDKKEINAIRKLIASGKLQEALERIRALNNTVGEAPKKRGRKKKKVVVEEPEEEEPEIEDNDEYDEEEYNDEYDEDIAWAMIPQCVRLGGCPEKFGQCKFFENLSKDWTKKELLDITTRYDKYQEYIESQREKQYVRKMDRH